MKHYFTVFIFLVFSIFLSKNSFSEVRESQNLDETYKGKLNNKIEVVFSLKIKNDHLIGFYYYDKIGIEIQLTGQILNGNAIIYEIDYQNKKQAKITGKFTQNGFIGKWENLSTKKTFSLRLEKVKYSVPVLPKNIIGTYTEEETSCQLSIKIAKNKGEYVYHFVSKTRTLKGKITFGRSLEENLVYINFNGIEWAEDRGDITNEADEESSSVSQNLPTVLQGLLSNNQISIQNYGNAMNYYLKIGECDVKYIHLKKK